MSLTFNFGFIKSYPSTTKPCINGNILLFGLITKSSAIAIQHIQNEKRNASFYIIRILVYITALCKRGVGIGSFLSKYTFGFQLYFLFHQNYF